MRMHFCYLDCHEAGLCCYLVIHLENLFRLLQLFYFHLCHTYLLTLPRRFERLSYLSVSKDRKEGNFAYIKELFVDRDCEKGKKDDSWFQLDVDISLL
jgi:hypothetical protein